MHDLLRWMTTRPAPANATGTSPPSRLALCAMALALAACQPRAAPPTTAEATAAGPLSERTFQRKDAAGEQLFTVRLRATNKVAPAVLDVLQQELGIQRARPVQRSEELAFWRDRPLPLDPARAEVQVELVPAVATVDPSSYVFTWPDLFQISRPGVLETTPGAERLAPRADPPQREDTGVVRTLDTGVAPRRIRGRLLCKGTPLPHLAVVAAGQKAQARDDGTFEISGPFPGVPGTLFMAYEAQIPLPTSSPATARLQIFDDFHVTRSDHVDRTPTLAGDTGELGDVEIPSDDCVIWQMGIKALTHYASVLDMLPPAKELRIKRWSAVYISAGAAPHTFHDYIVLPTDFVALRGEKTFFHEFGHSIRHVADGDKTHWDWDNVRFIYGRVHNGGQITNKGFTFNEGWGHFWSATVRGTGHGASVDPAFLDFNEDLIGERLVSLSGAIGGPTVGPPFMMRVLLANRGVIHTLQQFEEHYCAALGNASNAFCANGRPTRTAPSCPPGFSDDGLTCRLNNIVSKPSFGRGVGTVPNQCGAGREYDAGLCYPLCPAGFSGVGPVCWQRCPAGYADDGATCRRNASIFGSDNSACPWYDKCGLTFARGCSVCPAGYSNDGCTCRRNVHIFGKRTATRGVGTVPSACGAGLQYDAGLCYPACPAGYSGVGPVCWGTCPAGFADHGATCYRDPNVFSDDPVVAP